MSSEYKLAEPDLLNGDQLEVQGLIGIDIIQFFSEFKKVPCMLGAAYKVPSGLVPFGNIMHFLYGNQIISQGPVQPTSTEVSFTQAITRYDNDIPTTVVNFVLQPRKSYFSPLETLFPESAVEQGLENMFNLNYVGCGDSQEQHSQTDVMLVKEFEEGIQFKDNRYHVNLPWKKDVVDNVPSNHKVALSVLNRVVNKLEQNNLLDAYLKVFHTQLEDGIIERINVNPEDFDKYVWIPHRPIVKVEPNTTTKIRPVFNCSLKTDNKPSLNEAAFAGINLMGDIVKLNLYFR